MALVNKSKFETVDDSTGEIIENEAEAAPAAPAVDKKAEMAARLAEAQAAHAETAAPEAESKTHAIVAAKTAAVSVSIAKSNPFKGLENAFPVKFNTLTQIQGNQGNFIDKDTEKLLGDTIGVEIISWQRHYVLTPSDDSEEAAEHLKYSDDGVTSQDGENMIELLALTKVAGFPDAKIVERVFMVGCLFNAGKQADMTDKMVQIDLSPTSKAQFDRHQLSTAFNVGKGKLPAEGQELLKLECAVKNATKGGRKMQWTEVVFSQWK